MPKTKPTPTRPGHGPGPEIPAGDQTLLVVPVDLRASAGSPITAQSIADATTNALQKYFSNPPDQGWIVSGVVGYSFYQGVILTRPLPRKRRK